MKEEETMFERDTIIEERGYTIVEAERTSNRGISVIKSVELIEEGEEENWRPVKAIELIRDNQYYG